MCFQKNNPYYFEKLTKTLRMCKGQGEKAKLFDGERVEIAGRMNTSFRGCGSPSQFFKDVLLIGGEDSNLQQQIALNLYLSYNYEFVIGDVIQFVRTTGLKPTDDLFQTLLRNRSSIEILRAYLKGNLGINRNDIDDVVNLRIGVENLTAFHKMIERLGSLIIQPGKLMEIKMLLVHFIKTWNVFNCLVSNYNKFALIILDRLNAVIIRNIANVCYDLKSTLAELEALVFIGNHKLFPLFEGTPAQQEILPSSAVLNKKQSFFSNIDRLNLLFQKQLDFRELVDIYRGNFMGDVQYDGLKDQYQRRIRERMLKMKKEDIIKELGIDKLREGFQSNEPLMCDIIRRRYIYEVLI